MSGYNQTISTPNGPVVAGISSIIASSNTSISNLYSGFPGGVTTSNNWENPSSLGYQINGTDIANSIKAVYTDYGSNQDSYTELFPPSWCTRLKIIAIAGGGGGGSGGANSNNNDAGSGGSGAGGSMAIMVSNSDINPSQFKYSIFFTQGGTGGSYQNTVGDSGNVGSQGTNVNVTFINPSQNESGSFTVYGGGGGGWGPGTSKNNNDSNGGQNNHIYNNNSYGGNSNGNDINAGVAGGNNTTVPFNSNLGNFVNYFNITGVAGNSGAGGGNQWVGYSGVVANYNSNNDPPPLNSNIDYSSNGNAVQNNNTSIDNVPNPPVGQGGVGGWNSNNNNGYQGQQGGPALVRIYFLA